MACVDRDIERYLANRAEAARISKASVCFRVGTPLWLNSDRFDELLDLFDANPGVTDEITLFTSETHPPLPMDVNRMRAGILAERMDRARKRGYKSGINILATIGHHEENLPNSLSGDYTPMTDIDGNVSRGSLCPNDENLRAYAVELYQAMSDARPDYIWLDDDIRLWGHMPVGGCCFCDTCVARFSERIGRQYTRESLLNAFSEGPTPEKLSVRREWLEQNRRTMARLFALIEETVHAHRAGYAPRLHDRGQILRGVRLRRLGGRSGRTERGRSALAAGRRHLHRRTPGGHHQQGARCRSADGLPAAINEAHSVRTGELPLPAAEEEHSRDETGSCRLHRFGLHGHGVQRAFHV